MSCSLSLFGLINYVDKVLTEDVSKIQFSNCFWKLPLAPCGCFIDLKWLWEGHSCAALPPRAGGGDDLSFGLIQIWNTMAI